MGEIIKKFKQGINVKSVFRKMIVYLFCIIFVFLTQPFYTIAADDIDYHSMDYEAISLQIAKDVEEYHVPGMAVIVVDKDEVLFAETYGNCESIDTPFIIGSMSKSFTALSVMQLFEQGKLNLDAPISRYIDCLTYLKDPSEGDEITVRELLNHTSGLDTNHYFGNAKITESKGTYRYSNVGYGLLGKIVEAVSGMSYEEYAEQNIFQPLNMEHSAASLEKGMENGLISGYRNYFGIPVAGEPDYPDGSSPSRDSAPYSTVPAGYISSSAADMGKYLQMYLNGGMDIISRDSIDTMFYDYVPEDETGNDFYGMGWGYSLQFSQPLLNHAGLVENYTSNMFLIPEKEIGIVVLVNMNDYLVDNNLLGNIILPLLGEEKVSLPNHAYIIFHILIDLIYLVIIFVSIAPIVSIRKWKDKPKTKGLLVRDIMRHVIFPGLLLALPYILGSPLWLVWYFVKDLFFVLMFACVLLFGTGIYKVVVVRKNS